MLKKMLRWRELWGQINRLDTRFYLIVSLLVQVLGFVEFALGEISAWLITVLIHERYCVSVRDFYWNNISVIYIRVINDYHFTLMNVTGRNLDVINDRCVLVWNDCPGEHQRIKCLDDRCKEEAVVTTLMMLHRGVALN